MTIPEKNTAQGISSVTLTVDIFALIPELSCK